MEKMSTINNPFQKVVLQPGAISGSSPLQITGASLGSLTTASSNGHVKIEGRALHTKLVVESSVLSMELESEAFNVPVERLINLWVTRFGNKWIDLETLEGDEFFSNAFKRLKQLGEVEVHFLTDRARYVCRMPEQ